MAEQKSEAYLDRYEVVAVSLPGAASLLFIAYLDPRLIGTSHIELKDVTVGALGIFTIASVIAGQVIQAIGNVLEEILNSIADFCAASPVSSLPKHRRSAFDDKIEAMGVEESKVVSRRRYRKELSKDVIRVAKQGDATGALQIFNVTYGLNRGLSIASGAALIVAIVQRQSGAIALFAAIFAAVVYRAYRFSRRYEGEALRIFIESATPTPRVGESS